MGNELMIVGYDTPEDKKLISAVITLLDTLGLSKKATEDDKKAFIQTCLMAKVNPVLKEVYAVMYWNQEAGRYCLGSIPDYKTFLSRAERSGNLDGWKVDFRGEVVKKWIQKRGKRKDGSEYVIDVEVIDKSKTTLAGMITIWRKDQSHPHESRWLLLTDEMKDTAFWHDDPYGMLEKNLIREYFQKIFPKDCDIPDYTREARIIPDYEVIDGIHETQASQIVDKKEVLVLAAECNKLMGEFSMTGNKSIQFRKDIQEAAKMSDLARLNDIKDSLVEMRDKAVSATAQEIVVPLPQEVEVKAESADEAELISAAKMDLINVCEWMLKTHEYNHPYMKKSLEAHLNNQITIKGTTWDGIKKAILESNLDMDTIINAVHHYEKRMKDIALEAGKAVPEGDEKRRLAGAFKQAYSVADFYQIYQRAKSLTTASVTPERRKEVGALMGRLNLDQDAKDTYGLMLINAKTHDDLEAIETSLRKNYKEEGVE